MSVLMTALSLIPCKKQSMSKGNAKSEESSLKRLKKKEKLSRGRMLYRVSASHSRVIFSLFFSVRVSSASTLP